MFRGCVTALNQYFVFVGDMEKHLKLLAELTPDWLSIHPIRKDLYLKLNKTMDLSVVQDKLSRKIKEEERK